MTSPNNPSNPYPVEQSVNVIFAQQSEILRACDIDAGSRFDYFIDRDVNDFPVINSRVGTNWIDPSETVDILTVPPMSTLHFPLLSAAKFASDHNRTLKLGFNDSLITIVPGLWYGDVKKLEAGVTHEDPDAERSKANEINRNYLISPLAELVDAGIIPDAGRALALQDQVDSLSNGTHEDKDKANRILSAMSQMNTAIPQKSV